VTEQPTMGDDDLAEKTMLPMEFLLPRMATALLLLILKLGFQYFSSLPVLHYLQVVFFIEI
jgi:hypothetical protein